MSDPTAGVLAAVAAINSEIAEPTITAQVADAMQRLVVVQTLATALNDAVANLRGHATTHLAAIGAAAADLVATGDVTKWRETVDALEVTTRDSQQRLEALLGLIQRTTPKLDAK